MQKIFYVGLGGFIGAALRYIISSKMVSDTIPWGTLLVNVIGGVLIGLIMQLCLSTDYFSPNMKLFLTTGVLGGLTTFSTFSYESLSYFSQGRYLPGGANIVLNVGLSLLGVFLGRLLRQTLAAQ